MIKQHFQDTLCTTGVGRSHNVGGQRDNWAGWGGVLCGTVFNMSYTFKQSYPNFGYELIESRLQELSEGSPK